MTWTIIAQLIAQFGPAGIDLAETLWKKWTANTAPSQADFDQLRAMGSQTAKDRMKAQLVAAGIPLDDPKAVALLALT